MRCSNVGCTEFSVEVSKFKEPNTNACHACFFVLMMHKYTVLYVGLSHKIPRNTLKFGYSVTNCGIEIADKALHVTCKVTVLKYFTNLNIKKKHPA